MCKCNNYGESQNYIFSAVSGCINPIYRIFTYFLLISKQPSLLMEDYIDESILM